MNDCKHINWTIYGFHRVAPAECECLDCGKTIHLYIALNNWKKSVDDRITALENK